MFLKRLFSLIGGKLSRWLKSRELHDPEAVYEAAISDRVRRYQQLKTAAAGVIYMRNKLERELSQKAAELTEVSEQATQAAEMDEDECALLLIRRKHDLEADTTRIREELSELTAEADDAKKNLLRFKGEIDKLKVEKIRMLARFRNAQARIRIRRALEELSYDEDLRALQEVRESIQQMLGQSEVHRELHESEVDQKLDEIRRRNASGKAATELQELKRMRDAKQASMKVNSVDQHANGNQRAATNRDAMS
jgi:phage shock protein A